MKAKKEKKITKARKTRVIIGSIALTIIALSGILFYVTSSPRFIFGALLDKYYKGFSWALNNVSGNDFDINFMTEPVIAKGSFNADIQSDDVPYINQLSNFDLNYDLGLDLKNKKAEAGLGVSFSGGSLIDILAGYNNNQILMSLNGSKKVGKIYDKNLKLDLVNVQELIPFEMINSYLKAFRNSKMTTEDSQYIVKTIKDLINESLTDVKFEEPTKETINIDGSEFSATKYSLALDNENAKIILGHVLNGIINNETLINKIAQYTSTPATEIEEDFIAYAADLENVNTYVGTDLTLAVYTKGSIFFRDIVKASVFQNGEEVGYYTNYNNIIVINANNVGEEIPARIEYVKGESEDNLKVILADITFVEAKIRSLSSGNIDFDITVNFDDLGLGAVKLNLGLKMAYANKTWSGEASIYVVGVNFAFDAEATGGTVDIKVPFSISKVEDHKFAVDFSLDGNFDILDYVVSAKLSSNSTITNNIPVNQLDATNAKYYYYLTDDEITSIVNKFSSSLAGTTPGTLLESGKEEVTESITSAMDRLIYTENGPITDTADCDYYDLNENAAKLYTDGERLYTYNKNNSLSLFIPDADERYFSTSQLYPFNLCYTIIGH